MDLGEKLYELRKKNNWSQEELAEKLEVSRQTISKWESDKAIPELNKLVKLSEIYNITLDELVKETSEGKVKLKKKNNIKKISVILLIVILIFSILFTLNIVKRVKIINEISKRYKADFESIGTTRSGRVVENIVTKELNEVKESHKEYRYYVGEDGKKLLKIITYEGGEYWWQDPIGEYYIDLSKKNDDETYYDVTKINLSDRSREIINNFEYSSPISKTTSSLNNTYGIIRVYDRFDDTSKELALDFNNKFSKKEPCYIWANNNINGSKNSISMNFSNQNFHLHFNHYEEDVYEDDIREKREIIDIEITNIYLPIEEDMFVPEI